MGLSLALTYFGWVLALIVGTMFCYYGDGCSYHRSKLDFLPRLWTIIWFTGGFCACAIMEEPYLWVYVGSVIAAFLGWIFGGVMRAALWEPACQRLKNKMERQTALKTANG